SQHFEVHLGASEMSGETRTKGAENCPVIRSQQQRPQRCRNERAQHAEELRKRRAKKNEGDPDIVKSPSDHKEYRHIKLKNGMNVLLISDWTIDDCTSSDESDTELEDFLISSGTDEEEVLATKIQETERNDRNIKESEDGSLDGEVGSEGSYDFGSDGIVEGDPEVREDHDDLEIYEELVKQEDEKKMGSTEKQAAAALAVGVGSFCDPDDLPGLAHFLEHMVFMGSQKYPDENGFDTFLKKHGGSDNASTDTERTIFQFDIQKKYFKEALDRWAQFFIHPLMIKDAIDREVEAVDSEYQIAKPSDANRRELLLGSLAKPGHPMRKFFWGNAETLKYAPKKKGIDTYARLRDFRKRYYSAHYMNLVVQSRETLDTLQKWVTEIFSHIPDNGLPRPDFSHLMNPFDTLEFHKIYKIIPVKEIHSLNISWALPTQEKNYKVKPLHYISWLIGHEGFGLLPYMEEMVIHLIFQYFKMLQKNGPEKRIWEEIQKIEANEFCFQEQSDPIEFVENICENMHIFQKEDLLTGDQLLIEYNAEIIADALNQLTPEKVNIFLLSPSHEGQCTKKENWFGTQYCVLDIDRYWSNLWNTDFPLNPDLHLPQENKYIATDFSVKEASIHAPEYPTKIINTREGCLWYKEDNKFGVPKGFICFYLVSPIILQSALNMVLFDTFVSILSHNLAEPAYEADVAQLEYKVMAKEHGLAIRVKGFNHKLPLLFHLIINNLSDLKITPSNFQIITEQLKRSYFNYLIKADTLAKDIRLSILEHGRWSLIEKYQTLINGISIESLTKFVGAFKSNLWVEGLVQGNFTKNESKEFMNYISGKLQFHPLIHPCPIQFRVMELPNTHILCKVKSLHIGDANTDVTVYYQTGAKKLKDYTLTELLVCELSKLRYLTSKSVEFQMHMEEPCFDFLRTKNTLGYHVYPATRNTSGILGFSVTVTTQATKYNSEYVDKKIEEFFVHFEEKLQNLSEEEFLTQVSALIKLKRTDDSHLGEEVDRNWNEVITQQYVFDRLAREVAGYGKQEGDLNFRPSSVVQDSMFSREPQLNFLPSSPLLNIPSILDIRAFISTLNIFPYHKILK
ncbi:hypothetical protein Chor_002693, partial [Crotalus horridus]